MNLASFRVEQIPHKLRRRSIKCLLVSLFGSYTYESGSCGPQISLFDENEIKFLSKTKSFCSTCSPTMCMYKVQALSSFCNIIYVSPETQSTPEFLDISNLQLPAVKLASC